MTDISIVSSFYRVAAHLTLFVQRATQVASELHAQGVSVEFVIVANDVLPEERVVIDAFARDVGDVRVFSVERETLYASWNRGIRAATGEAIGFWNADDARTSNGLLDGLTRLRNGCELVYFRFEIHQNGRKLRDFAPTASDEVVHRRRMQAGPFFMFRRELFDRVGPFDERFRIVGDWEWCVRALEATRFCHSPVNAGTFFIHGENLSNLGSARDLIESNVVRLLMGKYGEITPAPPAEMRDVWNLWAQTKRLPPEVEAILWGAGAEEAWERWRIEEPRRRAAARRQEKLRAVPKWIVDRLGLRGVLARLGIVKARKPA